MHDGWRDLERAVGAAIDETTARHAARVVGRIKLARRRVVHVVIVVGDGRVNDVRHLVQRELEDTTRHGRQRDARLAQQTRRAQQVQDRVA